MFIVNSYQFATGSALLLDLHPAAAAYSLRKLRTGYAGSAIRVRRGGDNAEQDIGFVSGALDTTSLSTFAAGGNNNAVIVKWYNQGTGGSTYDAIQSTAAQQLLIISSGVLQLVNLLPSIVSSNAIVGRNPIPLNTKLEGVKTVFSVMKIDTLNAVNYLFGNNSGSGVTGGAFQGGTFGGVNGLGGFDGTIRSITGEDTNQQLGYINLRSGNLYAAKNGAAEISAGSYSSQFDIDRIIGNSASANTWFLGRSQELILYTTDESANKSAIESDINTYYGIY